MIVRTRFAPSPTGRLHLGHALAACFAHDLARKSTAGQFFLRFEDIDGSRVRAEYYAEIEQDLKWLGLTWDGEPLRQTSRLSAYQAALESLRERGLIYPCFCTRREIQQEWENMTAAPQGPEGPIYPGTCRVLSLSEKQKKIDANIPHAWRLDSATAYLTTSPLTFHDARHGTISVNPNVLGDVVLARKDIGPAYHLAVVVDDAWQKITNVTRGEDLLTSTHVHRLLQSLLEFPEPAYHHHPLVVDESGKRLAKRCDALSLAVMRESGVTAQDILARVRHKLPV